MFVFDGPSECLWVPFLSWLLVVVSLCGVFHVSLYSLFILTSKPSCLVGTHLVQRFSVIPSYGNMASHHICSFAILTLKCVPLQWLTNDNHEERQASRIVSRQFDAIYFDEYVRISTRDKKWRRRNYIYIVNPRTPPSSRTIRYCVSLWVEAIPIKLLKGPLNLSETEIWCIFYEMKGRTKGQTESK